MIVVLFFLSLFFLAKPALVQGFTYQFKLENNFINLDFSKIEPVIGSSTINEPSEKNNILSFVYKIETKQNLPADIPVFIVVFDKKVIFTADATLADDFFHTVEIDLKNHSLTESKQLPIFYKNNFFNKCEIDLLNIKFIKELTAERSLIEINDLNVIREKDSSVTVIFSVQEDVKSLHSYQLFCLNEQQQILNSIQLTQDDNFLWSEFSFLNFYANQKNEIIFHLTEFSCDGEVYVVGDGLFESNRTSIIGLENL